MALVAFIAALVFMITIALVYGMWKRLAHGQRRVLWHSKYVEYGFFVAMIILMFIGGMICGLFKPKPPHTFPFADDYPN